MEALRRKAASKRRKNQAPPFYGRTAWTWATRGPRGFVFTDNGARPGARKVALIQIGRGGQPSCAVELEPSFRTTLIRVGCRRTRSGLSCAHQAQTVPSVFPRHLTRPDDEAGHLSMPVW